MRARLEAWWQGPWAGFARGLVRRYSRARVPMLAAALAYYAAFAIGPLLLLLGGWLAVALRENTELAAPYQAALVALTADLLPLEGDPAALVDTSFQLIVTQLSEGALVRSILSVIVLLWASSSFFSSLQVALELIFDVRRPRGFLRKRMVAVLIVFAAAAFVAFEVVGGLIGGATAQALAQLRIFAARYDLALPVPDLPAAFDAIRFALSTTVFAIAFRYLPRRGSDAVGAWIGAITFTLGLLVMRQLLTGTFSVERVNLVYGVVTSVVVLLLWLFAALWLFLVSAVLAAEVSRWHRRQERVRRVARARERDRRRAQRNVDTST